VDVVPEVDAPVTDQVAGAAPSVSPSAQPRRIRHPRGDTTIDFSSANPTLRQLAAEKKPQDQFDWYVLVASWLKAHKQMPEIGVKQIVAANQFMGADWGALPIDAGQPFRDGCRSTSGIFEQTRRGYYKLTPNGEERVRRMGTRETA